MSPQQIQHVHNRSHLQLTVNIKSIIPCRHRSTYRCQTVHCS
jgi:hypothetical protein